MNDHIFENNNHDAVSIFLPRIIQIVNLTRVRMLSLKMRYIFTVTAIAGTNGKPGVMNITLFLKQTILKINKWIKLQEKRYHQNLLSFKFTYFAAFY